MDSVFIGVYMLYLADPLKIRQKLRNPIKFFNEAVKFAFPKTDEENKLYSRMKDEYLNKLEQYRTVEAIAGEGMPDDDTKKK